VTFFEPNLSETVELPRLLGADSTGSSREIELEVIRLFDENRSRLLAYVGAFGIAGHDGEEVVQEVFLALFCHLRSGKSRRNLRGWIFRVAHNQALKRRQSNQQWLSRSEPIESDAHSPSDPAPNPEEQAVSTQRQQRLVSVLNALAAQDRLCFCLRAEGLRYREIAQILDMSLGSVSLSLTRSLARFMRADTRVAECRKEVPR